MEKTSITVTTLVNAGLETVWAKWTEPVHIIKWNTASDEWHTPRAENDLRPGGMFSYRMESKDGQFGFDFGGIYDEVILQSKICYTLGDNRKTSITFSAEAGGVKISETFETENVNPIEMQRGGWQSILNNFKKYCESGIETRE